MVTICILQIITIFSCKVCKDRLFEEKKDPVCPVCNAPVEKNQIEEKTPKQRRIDKLIRIRKEILNIYNKKRNDFNSNKEYDDYLEHVEDISI